MSLAALPTPTPETVAQRVRRLQAEARVLADDHAKALVASILDAAQIAAEIASGGDAYPAGVRDLARLMVGELEGRALGLEAIRARSAR